MSLMHMTSCNYNCVNDGYIASWGNKAWSCCTLSLNKSILILILRLKNRCTTHSTQ